MTLFLALSALPSSSGAIVCSDAFVCALQLGFTDDIDPGLSLKLISQSILAFFNRHLPLTEAQRSQLQQPQVVLHSTPMPDASARGDGHQAISSQHMSSAKHQSSDRSQSATNHNFQSVAAQESGLQPGQVVLDGLSDGLNGSTALSSRTYESRVKPHERNDFEDICRGNIAILDLSL